jgi:hypothetical protein
MFMNNSRPDTALAFSLALVVAMLAGACGGGSGSSRMGTGGSTTGPGSGGSTTTGSGGAGGTIGTDGFACNAVTAPSTGYITDFSDWAGSKWGMTGLKGGVFTYIGTGSTITAVANTSNLVVTGAVMNYAGFGMYFDSCTNASAFTGLQFTVGGDLGMCTLELQVQTNSDKKVETSSMKGTCTAATCASATVKNLTVTPGQPITVHWTDLTGAAPAAFSAAEIDALQWQLTTSTGCTPNFTIDDIKFIKN